MSVLVRSRNSFKSLSRPTVNPLTEKQRPHHHSCQNIKDSVTVILPQTFLLMQDDIKRQEKKKHLNEFTQHEKHQKLRVLFWFKSQVCSMVIACPIGRL